jgi:hypothetical protein
MWERPLRPDGSALPMKPVGSKGLAHVGRYYFGSRIRRDGTHSSHFASYWV